MIHYSCMTSRSSYHTGDGPPRPMHGRQARCFAEWPWPMGQDACSSSLVVQLVWFYQGPGEGGGGDASPIANTDSEILVAIV